MPATDSVLEAARAAADAYVHAWLSRRRAYEVLPLDDPGRADVLGQLRDATRRAFAEYVQALDALHARGSQGEALALIFNVNERTGADRPPVEITVSED